MTLETLIKNLKCVDCKETFIHYSKHNYGKSAGRCEYCRVKHYNKMQLKYYRKKHKK